MNEDPDILEALKRHNIQHLIHFTPAVSLANILECNAIMSIKRLYEFAKQTGNTRLLDACYNNDPNRFDARTDCINLSLQKPNLRLFYVFRGRLPEHMGTPETGWCVLEIDPTYCAHPGVSFTPTNAATGRGRGAFQSQSGIDGFERLFNSPTATVPSDSQAEVLYPGEIPFSAVQSICLKSQEALATIRFGLEALGIDHSALPFKIVPEYFR